MFPGIPSRKAPPVKNAPRLLVLFVLHAGSVGLFAEESTGDRVVAGSMVPDRPCQQVSAAAAGSIYCLRKQELVRLSPAGKELSRYGDGVKRPDLLAGSESRVAVVDRNGLRVFDAPGEQLFSYDALDDPVAVAFQGTHLYLAEKNRLLRFDDTASPEVVIESGAGIKFSRFDFFAVDPGGFVYLARERGNDVDVIRPDHRSRHRLNLSEVKRIHGLAVDSASQLYVLATTRESRLRVFVYRGLERRFDFLVTGEFRPQGMSVVSPGSSVDSMVVFHDRKSGVVHQYEHHQVPARVIGVKASGRPDGVSLTWQQSSEPFVSGYELFASETEDGVFDKLGEYENAGAELRFDKKRYRVFSVSARSRSGQVGARSLPAINRFESGYQYYLDHRHVDVVNHFLKSIRTDSNEIAGHEYLVRSLLKLDRYGEAMIVAQQLRHRPGGSDLGARMQIEVLVGMRRYRQAEILLSPLLARQPGNKENLSWCAEIQKQLGHREAAIDCLGQLLQQDKENTRFQIALYGMLDQQRDRARRSIIARDLQHRAMTHPDETVMIELGRHHLANGNLKRAATWFSRALKRNGESLAARRGIASVYLESGQLARARAVALKLLVTDGQHAEGYQLLGRIARLQGNHGEAAHVFRKALAGAPTSQQALLGLAESYTALSNFQQARQTFGDVLRHHPGNRQALIRMARLEQESGHGASAEIYLRRLLHHHPVDREAELLLAGLYLERNQFWLATRHAAAADRLSPDETTSRLLSRLQYLQGHLAEASTQVRGLLKDNKNSIDLNLHLAEIEIRRGNFVTARKTLERVLRLDKNNKPAMEKLIAVYRELARYRLAVQVAKRLVRLDQQPRYRLQLNALLAEQRVRGKNQGASPVVFEKFKPFPLVTSALPRGQAVDLGEIVIRNRGPGALVDIEVKAFAADLPGVDMVQHIERIAPGKSHAHVVRMNVADYLAGVDQDRLLQLHLEATWQQDKHRGLLERSWWLPIMGRNTIDWQSPDSVHRFLARIENPGPVKGLPGLIDAFARLQLLMPEQLRGGSERHGLQLPEQTLQRRKGSHEELALLFASMLHGMDMELALVKTDKDFVLLVSDRDQWQDLALPGIQDKLFYRHDGRSWIPLDMGNWSTGFQQMWQRGLARIGNIEQPKPLALVPAGNKAALHFGHELDGREVSATLAWVTRGLTRDLLKQVLKQADAGKLSEEAVTDWWRNRGYPEAVVRLHEQQLASDRFNYESAMEIAELKAKAGLPGPAADYVRYASSLKPFDVASRARLAELLELAGKTDAATGTRKLVRKLEKLESAVP